MKEMGRPAGGSVRGGSAASFASGFEKHFKKHMQTFVILVQGVATEYGENVTDTRVQLLFVRFGYDIRDIF